MSHDVADQHFVPLARVPVIGVVIAGRAVVAAVLRRPPSARARASAARPFGRERCKARGVLLGLERRAHRVRVHIHVHAHAYTHAYFTCVQCEHASAWRMCTHDKHTRTLLPGPIYISGMHLALKYTNTRAVFARASRRARSLASHADRLSFSWSAVPNSLPQRFLCACVCRACVCVCVYVLLFALCMSCAICCVCCAGVQVHTASVPRRLMAAPRAVHP